MNILKAVNDLYKENYKPLKKQMEEHYRRWKDLLCLWIGNINIIKMTILSKAIYLFNTIPIKILINSLQRLKKIYPKVHLETQMTMNSQGNTE
jgi:hypothetical protein